MTDKADGERIFILCNVQAHKYNQPQTFVLPDIAGS